MNISSLSEGHEQPEIESLQFWHVPLTHTIISFLIWYCVVPEIMILTMNFENEKKQFLILTREQNNMTLLIS